MKKRLYFVTFTLILFAVSLAAQANVFFQNYTNSPLTVIYKYCKYQKAHPQDPCGSANTSGPIAPNSTYQVPAAPADYVNAYMANTADGWSYINLNGGSCYILMMTSDIIFANFSKSLLPEVLQCQQAARKIK